MRARSLLVGGCIVLAAMGSSPAWGDPFGTGATGPTGAGAPFDNVQPSLGLKYLIRVTGGTPEDLGEVALFAKTDRFTSGDPIDWMQAEGQLLPITPTYQDLFDLIGTTFGGDGVNDFALPDLRGRTAIGVDPGVISLGTAIGAEQQTLGNLPEHTHPLGSGQETLSFTGDGLHSNYQPSLALTPIIATEGFFPSQSSLALATNGPAAIGTGGDTFLGEITWIAHDQVPTGWMAADGTELSIFQNSALYSILGTRYGGDGITTFALPDLRGRAAMGTGQGAGLTQRTWGDAVGTAEETLSESQVPPHTHDLPGGLGPTGSAGGGDPQSNLQPSLAINYLVPTVGQFPSTSSSALALATSADSEESADEPDEIARLGSGQEPFLASVTMFAGNFQVRGYDYADGRLLPVSSNTALFSLLWNDYGGDAMNNFALPDLRGRIPVGIGQAPGLTDRQLAQQFGAEEGSLVAANLPEHAHLYQLPGDFNGDGVVDAADYAVWRDGLGGEYAPNDYNQWASNYGDTIALGGGASAGTEIPEPLTLALLTLAILFVGQARIDKG